MSEEEKLKELYRELWWALRKDRMEAEIRIARALIHRPEYKYFCCYCMTQYKERPEQCIFCGCREFKENTLENFINHEL